MTKQINTKGKTMNNGSQVSKFEARQHKACKKNNTSDTFWNLLRVEKNYKLDELSDVTGHTRWDISNWFTGKRMPNDYIIQEFCDLFGVNFKEGKLEFERGYATFHGRDGKTIATAPRKACKDVVDKVNAVVSRDKTVEPVKTSVEVKVETEPETPTTRSKIQRISERLYGVLNYADFITMTVMWNRDKSLEAILTWLYGKVDVMLFCDIAKIVNE